MKKTYLIALTLSALACNAQTYYNVEMFLPMDAGDYFQYTGTTYVVGPLTNVEVDTTAWGRTSLHQGGQDFDVFRWEGEIRSDPFVLLLQTVNLNIDFGYLWGPGDNEVLWYASSVGLVLGSLVDGLNSLYDNPISMLPSLFEEGETYSYNGTANGGSYIVRGDFEFLRIDSYAFPWGEMEGIWLRQSSPYDTLVSDFFLVRGFGVAGLVVYAESDGFQVTAVLSATSINRSYKPKPVFNTWDAEYRIDRSSFVYDVWFGYLYDDEFPWTYMVDFGWVYVDHAEWGNLWFYSVDRGWCYTDWNFFPYVYISAQDTWFKWPGN